MLDFIIITVVLFLLAGAVLYIKREKKKGIQCIGCPNAKNCMVDKKCKN